MDKTLDIEALSTKYAEERDKRLRGDGNDQYVMAEGQFARFTADPYVETVVRPARVDEVDVVVVGGGLGGLLTGARLREAGVSDICIIEKGGDFGGTWYWNRYPGARCDIESYVYMPLLEELGYMPTEKYAAGGEIFAHAQAIGRHYELYRDACFQTEVSEIRWDAESARWTVSTNRDDAIRARFVVTASGAAHRPKLPGIPGLDIFRGHSFHTSRWDYDYTGGRPGGGLDGLADKRVGIVGTGATAIQVVPMLAQSAKELLVFQRTPSSIDVRDNRPTDPTFAASLESGWQRQRMENFNSLFSGMYQAEDLVGDAWTSIIRRLMKEVVELPEPGSADYLEMMDRADFEKMEELRARIDSLVDDPATAEALKPYYRRMCKRPCFHDEYLQAFNQPNVTLVDTNGQGVSRITERGVVVGETLHELDCIIFATGFEIGVDYVQRPSCEIVGHNGLSLHDRWTDGARTLYGIAARGFPNLFMISPVQAAPGANITHLLDEQATTIAHIVRNVDAAGADVVEVSHAAEDAWVEEIVRNADLPLRFLASCTPGYFNSEGQIAEQSKLNSFYGLGTLVYFRLLGRLRADSELREFEMLQRRPKDAVPAQANC